MIVIPLQTYLAKKSSSQNLCHICQTLRPPPRPTFPSKPPSTFTTNAPFSPSIAVGCCCRYNLLHCSVASALGMRLCWMWFDVRRITLSTAKCEVIFNFENEIRSVCVHFFWVSQPLSDFVGQSVTELLVRLNLATCLSRFEGERDREREAISLKAV